MTPPKRALFYISSVIFGILWAIILNHVIITGSPRYARGYPAAALCSQIKPGFTLQEVEKKATTLGEPNYLRYERNQLTAGGADSTCTVQFDPNLNTVTSVTQSGPPITY